jgi:hypothetical protein
MGANPVSPYADCLGAPNHERAEARAVVSLPASTGRPSGAGDVISSRVNDRWPETDGH